MQGGSKKLQGTQGLVQGPKHASGAGSAAGRGSASQGSLRDLNLHASWGAGVCSMSTAEGVQTGSGGQGLGSISAV